MIRMKDSVASDVSNSGDSKFDWIECRLRRNASEFVHREIFEFKAVDVGELLGRVRDGVVLDRADQEVPGAAVLPGREGCAA